MKFGYTIIYTEDVSQSIEFFENAFGFKRRFIHESGYGELETGGTALAFASHELGKSNLPNGYVKANGDKPLGVEIALVTDDVAAAYTKALDESPRVLRRLQTLRRLSHEQEIKSFFTGDARTRCSDGAGASRRIPILMGRH
jgi:catechol 2,3-dioxygenase-like lactoylglutathione lyase family enzyme